MNKLRLGIVLAIITIVVLTTFGLKKDTPTKPASPEVKAEIGYLAPDFNLKDINGKSVKLSDLRGKPVYINFFATWCPPCKEEIPELQKFYNANKDKMVFLAIDITFNDKLEDVKTMIQENNLTYPILLDEDQKNGAAAIYEITGVPEHYFIDKDGILRDKAIGPMDLESLQQGFNKAQR
jgi:cytochrome c biogenesis protein CcmG, thiol:disulfide interchange protein DsbE